MRNNLGIYRSQNEGTTGTTEEKKTDKKEVAKGLQIRKFNGKIAEDKDKGTPEVKYVYERICLPWSRTGKDVEDKEVLGSVPSLAELMTYAQKLGFSTEFVLDKEDNPEGPSIVGFLIDGINSHFNRTSRVKAENTPESAKEKSIQMFMSKTGQDRKTAIETLKAMFGSM